MIRPFIAICALAICSTAFAQPQAARIKFFDVNKAKQMVADEFADPDTVKFRRMFLSEFTSDKGVKTIRLCGEVNAKNRMGGYDGYRGFIVDETMALVDPGENAQGMAEVRRQMFVAAYPTACGNRTKEIK